MTPDTASAAQRELPELTDEQCNEFRRLPCSFNDMVRAIYRAGASRPAVQQEGDVFPIARLYVEETEDGRSTHIAKATFYAPGLPPGAHDVYPVAGVMSPATPSPEDVSQKAWNVDTSAVKESLTPTTVEQAIAQLVTALAESKGWMMDYADAIIRDAIDRRDAAMTDEREALPEPDFRGMEIDGKQPHWYAEAQMLAYGDARAKAARDRAMEEAAKVCDRFVAAVSACRMVETDLQSLHQHDERATKMMHLGASNCAAAIRAIAAPGKRNG